MSGHRLGSRESTDCGHRILHIAMAEEAKIDIEEVIANLLTTIIGILTIFFLKNFLKIVNSIEDTIEKPGRPTGV